MKLRFSLSIEKLDNGYLIAGGRHTDYEHPPHFRVAKTMGKARQEARTLLEDFLRDNAGSKRGRPETEAF
ncbi:hypothetical protein [Shimia sp.]|uniref:hypothetical protein n=1 Tax=Shimia sp. TaxID=1954381 RepID=UPI003BA88D26